MVNLSVARRKGVKKMRRALILIVALVLVIGTASFTMAGTTSTKGNTRANVPQLKISDQQKSQMQSLHVQMLEVKKQILKDNLDSGVITQDQYKVMVARIDARLEAVKSGKFTPGMHRGRGCGQGNGACWQKPQAQ
jgi:uncharacterized membrane protein